MGEINTKESAQDIEFRNEITEKSRFVKQVREGIHKNIIGQEELIDALLIGLLADGHILLEGVPGLAKTLAIKTLSQVIDADFSRIQFTPDLLPADITGTLIYSRQNEDFLVRKGPIFAHLILADEINRAPAKVQSALLEAMQEKQVTIGDHSFPLPSPFLVMATQNPIEQEGTYNLPEAQVDRFMLKVLIDYPQKEEEMSIIELNLGQGIPTGQPIVNVEHILSAREDVRKVYLDEKIRRYIVDLVFATRSMGEVGLPDLSPMIRYGASPRASISLALAARAFAFMEGRAFVLPEDVRSVLHNVLRHRIGLSFEAEANEITADEIIKEIVNKVQVP